MERSMAGNFRCRDLGAGAWRLTTGLPEGGEVYLGGTDPSAASLLAVASLSRITIEWGQEGALVTLLTPGGTRQIRAKTALMHEPLARLYEALPLAGFDQRARRFWRRVFWLVRIPGGRRLLKLIARRSASRRPA